MPVDFSGTLTLDEVTSSAYVLSNLMMISVDEATIRLLSVKGSEWSTFSLDDQQNSIIEVTELVNALRYKGEKVTATQLHAFPRKIGNVTQTSIPEDIKLAVALLAEQYAAGYSLEDEQDENEMIVQEIGPVRAVYGKRTSAQPSDLGFPSARAWRILLKYLRDPRSVSLYRVS